MDVATKGNAADLHDQRLMALLRELVHERGRARTAEALAVDPRTLAACLKRGTPSRLVRAALERRLSAGPRRLDRLDAERRLWELEIMLIRDHELTLPPVSYPWDQFDRRDEVWGLERALAELTGERRRAVLLLWLRRVLTLGIW